MPVPSRNTTKATLPDDRTCVTQPRTVVTWPARSPSPAMRTMLNVIAVVEFTCEVRQPIHPLVRCQRYTVTCVTPPAPPLALRRGSVYDAVRTLALAHPRSVPPSFGTTGVSAQSRTSHYAGDGMLESISSAGYAPSPSPRIAGHVAATRTLNDRHATPQPGAGRCDTRVSTVNCFDPIQPRSARAGFVSLTPLPTAICRCLRRSVPTGVPPTITPTCGQWPPV